MSAPVRERTLRWEDPAISLAAVEGKSGLEAMQMFMDGRASAPIAALMNIAAAAVEDGHVTFEGLPGEEHYNPIGIVHGGFALTLMDSAMGCAVHTKLPAGVGYASTDVQVRFVRAITRDTGKVRCEGHVIHLGRTTAIAEATLVDGAGKLLAAGTTACAIFRP